MLNVKATRENKLITHGENEGLKIWDQYTDPDPVRIQTIVEPLIVS